MAEWRELVGTWQGAWAASVSSQNKPLLVTPGGILALQLQQHPSPPAHESLSFGDGVKGGDMAKKLLRLNEVRVLLALNKDPARPLTVNEIAEATGDDTPSKKGISTTMVSKALNGVLKSAKAHESTGYPGLIEREYVKRVGEGFQISLPDPHPGSGSGETDEDEE